VHKLDNLYEGLPIYVVSTGTSLRGFDFSRLNGRITIGINRIVEYYHPSIMHFIDVTAHKTHAKALESYNGLIIAGPGAGPIETHDHVFEIHRNLDTFELVGNHTTMSTNVTRSFADGFFGGGAGCTALHAAILLGGDPIYLLTPSDDEVFEALRALYLIGRPEDLADVTAATGPGTVVSTRVQQQAALTAEAIRGRKP